MMAELESKLIIGAEDRTGGAFAAIKAQIAALDKQIATFDKLMAAAGKVAKSTDPMIASIAASSKALNEQKLAVTALGESLTGMGGGADAAAVAQRELGAAVESSTRLMVVQGAEAVRVAEQIAGAQRRSAGAARQGGGFRHAFNEMLPFAGPGILEGTKKAIEEGGTLEEEIQRLHVMGAKADEIAKARADFLEFSKTHSGVLEADYLAGYRAARTIAPSEPFEMARLGGEYRAALRNSGLSSSETDVDNVMRIMDELGLKSGAEREDFLNSVLKSQQAFGSQISTETMLSAYRH